MPFFSIYSFISYCLLCIHLWLPQLVKTESVKLYFRSRMQAVSEGCFVLLLFWFGLVLGLFFFFFFWTLAFFVCLSLFSFTLCCLSLCSQPCPHGLQHPSSKTFQKKAERSQDALILLLSLPWPSIPVFHLAQEPGLWEVGCQQLREVLGMP